MGCGCGGGGNKGAKPRNNRIIAPARIAASAAVPPKPTNNIAPMAMAPVQLPPPNGTEAEKRRMQKLRQEAKLRSLGRLY